MNSVSGELLYALLFAAVLLVQYLLKRFGDRLLPDDALQEPPVPEAQPAERETPVPARPTSEAVVPAVSFAAAERTARLEAFAASAAKPRKRSASISLLSNGPDLRRAIVGMTVLGPCRAQEPKESR